MSHVGKLYKVWFRRDVARRTLHNTSGFPEAFRFFIDHEITSARYVTEQLTGQLGINTSKAFERKWTSPVVGNFFDNCYWRISFENDPNEDERQIRFEIRHSALVETPLANVLYDLTSLSGNYDRWITSYPREIRFLSPDINFNPLNSELQFIAARWPIYNPA